MADTKTKKVERASKPKRASTRKAKPKTAKRKSAKPKMAKAKTVTRAKATSNGGKDVGQATGDVVRKARIPLLAGGAAIAGTVGGVVFGATRSGGKVLGVQLPATKRVKIRSKDLAKAAKEVGRFGESVGDLTTELKKAREGLANGNGGHDSPVEVLLKGLTHRR